MYGRPANLNHLLLTSRRRPPRPRQPDSLPGILINRVGFIGSPDRDVLSQQLLDLGDCEVTLWNPDQAPQPSRDSDLAAFADIPLIFITGGIDRCRPVARRLGDVITGRHIVVHTIRGIEPSTLNSVSDILHEETPTRRLGFVTGPMKPTDLAQGRPASAVCASAFPEVHALVEEAMSSTRLRIYRSPDLMGAELAAAYGRVIALVCGIGAGLEMGPSLEATLFTRGLAEVGRFVVSHGGHERTCFGLSGAGNLYVDIAGRGSLDCRIGRYLVTHSRATTDAVIDAFGPPAAELFELITALDEMAATHCLELHLLDAVTALVTGGADTATVVKALMALPALDE